MADHLQTLGIVGTAFHQRVRFVPQCQGHKNIKSANCNDSHCFKNMAKVRKNTLAEG